MEEKEKSEIEKTVREILDQSDLDTMTEFQIRKTASERLGLDLNTSHYKSFVRHLVDSYLQQLQPQPEQAEEGEGDDQQQQQEFDDDGDLIICRLSARRRVTLQNFKGMNLLSIREYYSKDGKELPSSKGISLKEDQWETLKKNIPAIEAAIKELEDRNA